MEITPLLDAIRAAFPACRSVGYADLSTTMMLGTSTREPVQQERWDALCATATRLLSGEVAARLSEATGLPAQVALGHAIIVETAEMGLFVRSQSNPADALCCICAPNITLAPFLQTAHATLRRIDHDG